MLEQKQNKIIVKRSKINTVSYTVDFPRRRSDEIPPYVNIDVEQEDDGFVHSLKIRTFSMLDGEKCLSNLELKALFELFKQERLYVERDEDGC
ncbi:MAG: hypothetical protein QXS29_06175 [Nitrososphaeria archaeon]